MGYQINTYKHMHDFLQYTGRSSSWVDDDFDLEEHNDIYKKLIGSVEVDKDADKAIHYSCMGHRVPEELKNRLKEKNLWITETPSDLPDKTSTSTETETPKQSWWSRQISRARSFWMSMRSTK